MDKRTEFKNRIDDLIIEFKELSGMEIHEIFEELADGTLTHVYHLRKKKPTNPDNE